MSPSINEKELLSRLAELPREMSPEHDPWPLISARIERSGIRGVRSAPAWLLRAVAASLVLVVAGGLLLRPSSITNSRSGDETGASSQVVSVRHDGRVDANETPGLLESIDAEYLAAFREFAGVAGSRTDLAPQTVEKIETSWAELRVTESALGVALEENPGDLFLNERMLELRARQLGFLKQLITLDRSNRRMTI